VSITTTFMHCPRYLSIYIKETSTNCQASEKCQPIGVE